MGTFTPSILSGSTALGVQYLSELILHHAQQDDATDTFQSTARTAQQAPINIHIDSTTHVT